MSTSTKRTLLDTLEQGDGPLANQTLPCECESSLKRRVRLFLQSRSIPGVEGIKVEADGNTVTLHGVLPSSNAKRVCLECCRHVAGVIRLIDDVVVGPQTNWGQQSEIEEAKSYVSFCDLRKKAR